VTVGADSTGAQAVKHQGPVGLSSAFHSLNDRLYARLVICSPVFLVAGIWTYFAVSNEPNFLFSIGLGITALVLASGNRSNSFALAIALIIFGFVLGKLRTEFVATPLVRAFQSDVLIEGFVSDVERRGRILTVVVEVERLIGLPESEKPVALRLRLSGENDQLHIGDKIRSVANVFPLPRPVQPGAFDYGRTLYFQSIGGMGEGRNGYEQLAEGVPVKYVLRRSFHSLRQTIGARVTAAIEGPLGSFADAIITGERAAIPNTMTESLQRSGLFHILSISGLHMTLVAGGVFWLVRALLALIPHAALTYPIKKWAALAALLAGLFYMLMADSGAATERSYIMIAVMFMAVLVDRPAISLHNLAIAAIIILFFQPEQALAASFQMSFMAVMGIAAFFEWWNARPAVRPAPSIARHIFRKLSRIIIASLATSFVAGTLSSVPAAFHFGRLAPFSIVANLLALPIVGFMIMPMALLGTALIPLGLEYLPFKVMEVGLGLLMQISDGIAGWQWSRLALPHLPLVPAVALALAATILCLVSSRWRLLSLPVVLIAFWWGGHGSRADVLVEERVRNVAIRNTDGLLALAQPNRTRFAASKWLQGDGDTGKIGDFKKRSGWLCRDSVCLAVTGAGTVAYLLPEAEPRRPCPTADILISSYPLRNKCKGLKLTIDRFDVWRSGAFAIYAEEPGLVTSNSVVSQGNRPWVYTPRPRLLKDGKTR
jgi:competence protein ComEC